MVLPFRVMERLHIEAVWDVKLPPLTRDHIELLPESRLPSWSLYVAELVNASIHIWRPGIDAVERTALLNKMKRDAMQKAVRPESSTLSSEIVLAHHFEPAISLYSAEKLARPLTLDDHELVEAFDPDFADRFFQVDLQPCIGVIVDGVLVSVAHSSRRTAEACELGIDTLPEERRKGYALAATTLWTVIVTEEGRLPLYSAFADNVASLRLAEAAGYRPFARGTYLGV